jgi:hypothetical protein
MRGSRRKDSKLWFPTVGIFATVAAWLELETSEPATTAGPVPMLRAAADANRGLVQIDFALP